MDSRALLTRDVAASLLRPINPSVFISAEQERPWSCSILDELSDNPLMRTYDEMSGSQPDSETSRMLARDARMPLNDKRSRKRTLEIHGNHKLWEATPYISFTTSQHALEELANMRSYRKRGSQKVVVVDPHTRSKLGLPILNYSGEVAYYEIKTPYQKDYSHNHYLCLWEVTPIEVVGIWEWNDLKEDANWYENSIKPAVDEHQQRRKDDEPEKAAQRRVSQDSVGDTYDDTSDGPSCSESDDSYERVCEENPEGELMKILEELRLS